jgi:hypothetical protein
MWRRKWNSDPTQVDDPGSMRPTEGLGVGRKFANTRYAMSPGYEVQRVNAFHPSFAVNYYFHMSCLRQLLVLEVAQACGLYRGQWYNDSWMDELREHCQAKIKEIPKYETV